MRRTTAYWGSQSSCARPVLNALHQFAQLNDEEHVVVAPSSGRPANEAMGLHVRRDGATDMHGSPRANEVRALAALPSHSEPLGLAA